MRRTAPTTDSAPSVDTFQVVADTCLWQKSQSLAPTTLYLYRKILHAHILPAFGHRHIASITEADLLAYFADRQRVLVPNSLRIHLRILKPLFAFAVEWGWCSSNPCAFLTTQRLFSTCAKALTEEEALRFLDAARSSPYYLWYLTALLTGLRHGELAGLRWEHVDLDRECLTVTQVRVYDGIRWIVKEPRRPASRRTIPLPPTLVEALHDRYQQRTARQVLVFSHPDGRPWSGPDLAHRILRRMLKRAGLPRIRLHDLRHTYARLLLQRGIPIREVSKRLGHADVMTTQMILPSSPMTPLRSDRDAGIETMRGA